MQDILNSVMDIGEEMLISGAEVHRVEDCMGRICHALGASRVDAFIIISSMVLTVHDENGVAYTQTRRINSLGTDFTKLDKLNALSRRICAGGMTPKEINAEISAIKAGVKYPLWVEYLMYAMIAAAFTLFFGGTPLQASMSLLIGLSLRFVGYVSEKIMKNTIFSKFLCAFVASALAFAMLRLNIVAKTDEIIIGNIMLLIPGLGFTNALRDLFTGDSIAGALRLLEAILSAAAIAAGYFLLVFMTGGGAV